MDYAHQNSVDPKGSSFMDLLNGVPDGSQRRAISQARLRLMNAISALHSGRLAPTAVAFHHLGYAMDALEHAVPVHIRERNRAKRGSGSRLGTMIRDSFQVNSPAAKAEVHLDWLAQREGWTLESDVVRARQSRKRLFTLAHFRNALAMERKQLRVNS